MLAEGVCCSKIIKYLSYHYYHYYKFKPGCHIDVTVGDFFPYTIKSMIESIAVPGKHLWFPYDPDFR